MFLRGNKLAENFESFLYVCPNCNQFFSIISEFSCLKCHNCGTAFEFSNSGEIDLCKHFSTIDEASEFQYSLLSSIKPSFDRLFSYNNLKVKDFFTNSTTQYMECPSFEIYQNKIDFVLYDNKTTIPFESLIDVYIDYGNQIFFTWKTKDDLLDKYVFKGDNKENFYVILDLIKLFKANIEYFSNKSE